MFPGLGVLPVVTMLNMFRVIALEAIDVKGQHYEPGDELDLYAHDCAPLLVRQQVRLANTPAPPAAPVRKRRRGRPRKAIIVATSPAA